MAIFKSKVTWMLIKPAYVGMCILHLKALMYEFNYDYNKKNIVTTQDYYSLTLKDWCMKNTKEGVYEYFKRWRKRIKTV